MPSDWDEAGQRGWGLGAAFGVFVKSLIVKTWNLWRKKVPFCVSSLGLTAWVAFREAIQKASTNSYFFEYFP